MLFKIYGRNPAGLMLERMKQSSNYKKGTFQNISDTPAMAPGVSFLKILDAFLNRPSNISPAVGLPFVKTDLHSYRTDEATITWFGHSSYFIHIQDKNILVDPVFSGSASPFGFMMRAFKGSNEYSVADFPQIDLLLLTHDHYDHLDYKTVSLLKAGVKKIVCSLGVSSHLVYWGFAEKNITELDWWDTCLVAQDLSLTAAPARHFSGRGTKRGATLWSSFILKTTDYKLYLGGDSGYDDHFKEIGEKHGPFDIAILECGQYNQWWPYIHMMPEETVQAAIDLKAKWLMPVHWGKFALSLHPWDEPIKRVTEEAAKLNVNVTTPMIGEPVILHKNYPQKRWWALK